MSEAVTANENIDHAAPRGSMAQDLLYGNVSGDHRCQAGMSPQENRATALLSV